MAELHSSIRDVYNEAMNNVEAALQNCENAQNIARVASRSYENMLEQIVEAGEQRKEQGNGDIPPTLIKVLYTVARASFLRCAVYHLDQYEPSEKMVQDLWGSSSKELRQKYDMCVNMLPILFTLDEGMSENEENQE